MSGIFQSIKRARIFLLLTFCAFLLCFFHALPCVLNADFWPINGDFQNYNPVRRFLSGQVPFKDFSLYLGAGHLFFGSVATFVLGLGNPNFATSKMAFSFLAFFSFCSLSYAIFSSVFKTQKRTLAIFATNVAALFLLLNPSVFSKCLCLHEDFYSSLRASLSSGNSARFLRGIAPAVFLAIFFLLNFLKNKISFLKRNSIFFQSACFGISCGIIIYFSNDYGLATAICAFSIYFLKIIFSKMPISKKAFEMFLLFIFSSISFFVAGEILTCGNIDSYFSKTFGTGGMQLWYYGYWSKDLYLKIDKNFLQLLQGFVAFFYLILFLKNRPQKIKPRFFVPLLMNAAGFAASNEYFLLSGGHLHEVSYSILWLTFWAEFLNFFLCREKRIFPKKIFNIKNATFAIFGAVLVFAACVFPIDILKNDGGGVNISGLGKVHRLASSILKADDFLGSDKKIFATYASAIEAHRGQFQPSPYDYIIHVLGSKARSEYLSAFKKCDFDYVATIKENFAPWEYWVRNANWFFYRELYKNYEVVWENDYERFWKKRKIGLPKIECKIHVEKITSSKYKIKVFAPAVKKGFCDVRISYETKKDKSKHSLLTFKTLLKVENVSGYSHTKDEHDAAFNLDSKAKDAFIGIAIFDGAGEIVLKSQPERNTYIENFFAEAVDVFLQN